MNLEVLHSLVNADFSRRLVIATGQLPWVPSPSLGIERRLLDRIGGEVARATSIVRYARGSKFAAHVHALGEEFLVLDGTFSDEHGDYPAGTYVRNPPGSHHAPRTGPGCTIFVKLRQMPPNEKKRVVIDTSDPAWEPGAVDGHLRFPLYSAIRTAERVTMERLGGGIALPECDCPRGEEILMLIGDLADEHGSYRPGTWIRNPPGFRRALRSQGGAIFWAKRGHLSVTS